MRYLLSVSLFIASFCLLQAQNIMVIHQGNGTRIQLPLESIDSIRFVTLPPPVVQKIFQNNGNVLAISVSDIDSITYTLPSAASLALVGTETVTALGTSTAFAQGSVFDQGSSNVTQRGFCWSLQPMPSLANNYSNNGAGTGNFGATIGPLIAGSTYYVRAYAINSAGTAYGEQLTFSTQAPSAQGNLATVSTNQIVYNGGLSASSGGNISADGGLAVTARGVCWAVGTTPTLNHNYTVDGGGAGSFSSTLTNLLANTTYFVRAYATNDAGTSYGVSYQFATGGFPIITTSPISSIAATFASSGGLISSDGGGTITSRGICWSTSPNPTIDLSTKTIDGTGIGTFTSNLTSLSPNTQYYVRAYATNSTGTAYGSQLSFSTLSVVLPSISTTALSAITAISAKSGGNITNDGGAAITSRGVCWSISPSPTIALTTKTNNGTGSGSFISNLTGLNPGTVYYIRSYATNSAGTAYGNELSFSTAAQLANISTTSASLITVTSARSGGNISDDGGSSITARGVCWSTNPNPTIALSTKTNDGAGSGTFISNLTDLSPGTTYYVQAYVTNSAGTSYGNQVTFNTVASLPTLSTISPLAVTATSASSGGNITADGGSSIIARGVCWSTNPNPTIALSTKTNDGVGPGTFTSSLIGLSPGTNYYIRAYATNSSGTGYGNQVVFQTTVLPLVNIQNIQSWAGQFQPDSCSDGPNPVYLNDTVRVRGVVINNGGLNETSGQTRWIWIRDISAQPSTPYGNISVRNSVATTPTDIDSLVSGDTIEVIGIVTELNPTTLGETQLKPIDGGVHLLSALPGPAPAAFPVQVGWLNGNLNNDGQPTNRLTSGEKFEGNFVQINNVTVVNVVPSGDRVRILVKDNNDNHIWVYDRFKTHRISNGFVPPNVGDTYSSIRGLVESWKNGCDPNATASRGYTINPFSLSHFVFAPIGISTSAVTSITMTTAISGGDITSTGGSNIAARGVCWSTTENPTVALTTKTLDGSGTGTFTSNITGLSPGTTYYVRSYATNSAGTSYGNQVGFTTAAVVLASLVTTNVSSITPSAASSGGNIINSGVGAIAARGICWSTSQNPTIALTTKTIDGSGTGSFTSNLTGLSPNTVYYVRAYATNSAGTAYGNEVSFTTATPSIPVDIDGNVYTTVTIGTQVWMKENLKVSKYRNGDPIPTNLSATDWNLLTTGAYSIYNNDVANNTTYGKLYNWYAVTDSRNLCPVGWHVPSDVEWTTLQNYLGGMNIAGGKLKSTSSLWTPPNTGATNESGFSGLPGGRRSGYGNSSQTAEYEYMGVYAHWWSTTQSPTSGLYYTSAWLYRQSTYPKQYGFSVRCLSD